MNKVFQSVEAIRHLEATRHSTVEGMNANHRFIIERERASWQNQLNLKNDLLKYEEKQTKEHLKVYLEHLKRMKEVKVQLEQIEEDKTKYEEQHKAF